MSDTDSLDAALREARDVLDASAEATNGLQMRFDDRAYRAALELLQRTRAAGRHVHLSGIGKPEHLARYGASLFSSIGTPAFFLHATEALHGSLGQIEAGDVVIAISNSGATAELNDMTIHCQKNGAALIAVTGDPESPLARSAEVTLYAGAPREGGGLELAPRASAVAEIAVLAALSAGLESLASFTHEDYHARHPAGRLGERSKR